jgi:exonuclease SbcC
LYDTKSEITAAKNHLVQTQRTLSEQIKQLGPIKLEIEKKELEKGSLQKEIQQVSANVNDLTVRFTEKKTNLNRMEEVIPETQRDKYTDWAVLGFMGGFTIMMILDVALG